jgi:hypothetical protein
VQIAIVVALCVASGGFVVARAFRFRNFHKRDEARRQRRDEVSRRHHFRGSLDMELDQGIPQHRRGIPGDA